VQRQPVEILLDQDRGDEREPQLTVRHDRLARWRAHWRALACGARELLADVAAHDHLRRQELYHLGDVRLDAHAIFTALRTGALRGRHLDRIVDPAQVRGRLRRPRLSGRRWRAQLGDIVVVALVDPGRCAQVIIGGEQRRALVRGLAALRRLTFGALERIEEQHELRSRDLLARLEPRGETRQPSLEVGGVSDQLADDR
jgi:hypothetical protein